MYDCGRSIPLSIPLRSDHHDTQLKPARRPIGEIWKAGLIGAGVAAIINVALYLLGRALGSFPPTALTPMSRPVDALGAAVLSVFACWLAPWSTPS